MYAIASLLDPITDQGVRDLWSRFENRCGLTGVQATPLPHFSWQGADAYQEEPVIEVLSDVARRTAPFTVMAAGLAMFTGPAPVVYMPIVKNRFLLDLHQLLWEHLRPFAVVPNLLYDPDHWIPHVTLAYREVQPDLLACAVADMAFTRIEFIIHVDHFAVLYQTDGKAGLHSRFPFGLNYPPGD